MTESHEIIDLDETHQVNIEDKVASRGIRFANYLIDIITISILAGSIANYVFAGEFSLLVEPHDKELQATLLQYFIILLYYILFEFFAGKTLGKLVTGSKVVNANFEKASFGQIAGRSFARFIPFEAFSFFGKKGIGWHDSLSKTYVIKG